MKEEYIRNYVINKDGTIYSKYTQKKLKPYLSNNGYLRVTLWNKGKGKHFSVHRLVAEAFIPNPENKPDVNHEDGNKENCCVSNLTWATKSENMEHAYKNNLINIPKTRVIQYSKDMKKIKIWESIDDVEKELKINHANIVTVCKQTTNRKTAGGYIWRYENEK